MTEVGRDFTRVYFKSEEYINNLKEIRSKYQTFEENFDGCEVKKDPGIFGFFLYWQCINKLNAIVLYFPYLVLTLAFVLILLERIFTRYMWTGQRIEKFYNLLVKEVIEREHS